MKLKKFICVLLLCALCIGAWCARITNRVKENREFSQTLEDAQAFENDGLYQRALASYQSAISMKDTPQLREKQLKAAKLAFDDNVISRNEYIQMIESACLTYSDHRGFWELAFEECLTLEDYKTGYRLARKMPDVLIEDQNIRKMQLEIAYSFNPGAYLYSDVSCSPDGYAAVCEMEQWGAREPDGDELYSGKYLYIGPINTELDAILCTEEESRIIDKDGVVQARFQQQFTKANAYGDGMLPICIEGKWSYFDCNERVLLPDSYVQASSYQNGIAAIYNGDSWELIDCSGRNIGETQFCDVMLYGNGQYCYQKRMVASIDGSQYSLFDEKGKNVCDFFSQKMDVFMGDLIAFADASNHWGFVDEKGNIVIDPTYEEAKSFSNGLAAVKKDGKWGFINKAGEMVIAPQFVQAGYFTKSGSCYVGDSEDSYYMITLNFPEGL